MNQWTAAYTTAASLMWCGKILKLLPEIRDSKSKRSTYDYNFRGPKQLPADLDVNAIARGTLRPHQTAGLKSEKLFDRHTAAFEAGLDLKRDIS